MKVFPITEKIKNFSDIFTRNGFKLYIVGGAVRDYLLGINNEDYDFTTDAEPEQVISMFRKTIPTGIKHGTVTVLFQNESFEVTTFRSEDEYLDGRHPSKVNFVRSLEEDLKRRDFTINALAADTKNGKIIDYHEGLLDLKNGLIKAIGNPIERFQEDGLRTMRACRFVSKLDFSLDENTFLAMKEMKDNIKNVSFERIREELYKLLKGKAPKRGLQLLFDSGIMEIILPEISSLKGVAQGGLHHEDVFDHTLSTVEAANYLNYPLNIRIAALLHDIGKKDTQQIDEIRFSYTNEAYSFYNHENIGFDLSEQILKRLKDSNENISFISNLVKNHMFNYTPDWKDGAVKRFINRVGIDSIHSLFCLRMCDQMAISGKCSWSSVSELEQRINKILKSEEALTVKDLKINGKDLMNLNIPKGPMFKTILNYLLETVLDDPSQNNKDTLITIAKNFYETIK